MALALAALQLVLIMTSLYTKAPLLSLSKGAAVVDHSLYWKVYDCV